jgi:hypothetical protein
MRAQKNPDSRQVAYQKRHAQEGLCQRCAEPVAPGSKNSCPRHLQQDRERKRVSLGLKPWQAGQRGRRPLGDAG